MTFISSSEAKNTYFMSGEATNEIYIFSLHKPRESIDFTVNIKISIFSVHLMK